MAASSYSSDILQRYYGRIDEAIQSLPPEIREIIHEEYVAKKQRERAALGWNKVYEALLKKPFCTNRQQCIPDFICIKCMNHRFGGCTFCREIARLRRHGLLQTSNEDWDELLE